ncbi:hypothetical protein SAMN04489727_4875 [Amycolatopsis tolypomycina]|uniref:Uncharacterized protein n=1 Tax=Amycolatopsis tolypomycina TaxID=208445 RepID=A0A1H4UXD8_9PSEU|nr:hypothetical protein SAMN04489727_4875 [Amycolatopsis tolypomycina]
MLSREITARAQTERCSHSRAPLTNPPQTSASTAHPREQCSRREHRSSPQQRRPLHFESTALASEQESLNREHRSRVTAGTAHNREHRSPFAHNGIHNREHCSHDPQPEARPHAGARGDRIERATESTAPPRPPWSALERRSHQRALLSPDSACLTTKSTARARQHEATPRAPLTEKCTAHAASSAALQSESTAHSTSGSREQGAGSREQGAAINFESTAHKSSKAPESRAITAHSPSRPQQPTAESPARHPASGDHGSPTAASPDTCPTPPPAAR